MMTLHEAIQRLRNSHMAIRRLGAEWQVFFVEDKYQRANNTYVTDDLEDAVYEGSKMRINRLASI